MVYDAMLLFGVIFVAGLIFDILTQGQNSTNLRYARQFWLFFIIGAYFIACWCRSGQTLAMKTWRIQLIVPDFARIPFSKAVARYVLAWMWFVPAATLVYVLEIKGWPAISGLFAVGVTAWAATTRLDQNHQFLHDRLLGTKLVLLEKSK